ncbi:MAG: hypothetical protein CME88_15260 [Hirschia sp.]|nr:hypothetical protein [Hirschia sp.]MBF19736.1 hypothetical protein [Hirschia sp.]|tara:strand:- start:256 stop:1068 length:813 start_codon:yes stop_codon:yes gene_type:complete
MNQRQQLIEIISRYCDIFPDQLRYLSGMVATVCYSRPLNEKKLELAMHECHRMGGTAHCMGYRYMGTILISLENDLLKAKSSPAEQVDAQLQVIKKKLARIYGVVRHITPPNSLLIRASETDDVEESSPEYSSVDACSPGHAEHRILVADDDESIRALVALTLQDAGFGKVEMAASGEAALSIAHDFNPTMLIADWMMSPMSGMDLLEAIRSGDTPFQPSIPVIFISTLNEQRRIHKVIRSGADFFLLKPFTQKELVNGVSQVARKKLAA